MSRTDALKRKLEEIILNPENAELLAILKAARNGAVYGAKVRFPHALVMTFLFRSGTLREKVDAIFAATRSHALVLARYAAVYKLVMFCLKYMGSDVGKEGTHDTFIAGLIGGYLIFGRRSSRGQISPVSKQIVIFGTNRATRMKFHFNKLQQYLRGHFYLWPRFPSIPLRVSSRITNCPNKFLMGHGHSLQL